MFYHVKRSFFLSMLMMMLAAPAAWAQGGPPQQQAPPPSDVEVSDSEIEQIAQAYVVIQDVRQKYQEAFNQVEDPQEAQQMQQQLAAEVNQIIEDHDLTIEFYDEVIRATQVNEELHDRLLDEINAILEARGSNG